MPVLGEVRRQKDIWPERPISSKSDLLRKYTWTACPVCKKERWVERRSRNLRPGRCYGRCRPCVARGKYGVESISWRGGKHFVSGGYIVVYVHPLDFYHPMSPQNNHVLEHRLVMAKHLGRCLQRWELVHHKNGIKIDNRIENLQLVTDDRHTQITLLEKRISYLEKRITLLEAENQLLKTNSAQTEARLAWGQR